MSKVELLRHSYKDDVFTGRLSNKGRQEAYLQGQELASQNPGKQIIAYGSSVGAEGLYIGRGADTAVHHMEGAGTQYDINTAVDTRLNINWTADDVATFKKLKEENPKLTTLELALMAFRDTVFSDTVNVASFIDEYVRGDDSIVYVGDSHSPEVEALAYLITGDLESTKGPATELTGITVEYLDEVGIYKLVLNYADGKKVVVSDTDTLAEKVEQTIEDIVEQEGEALNCDAEEEGAEEAEASE